jgi:23S rRNA (guanosine2251-2'-O)-methyltransferase
MRRRGAAQSGAASKLFVTNGENRLKDAIATRKHLDAIGIARVTPRDLDRRLGADTVHQGVLLECDPLPEPTLADLAELPDTSGPLVVLDQVTDPHNVGAILRSAAVFGTQGLVMTRRHSPPLGGVLAKSASGALEHVPVALVPNLARALIELGGLAYRRIGLDGTGDVDVVDEPFRGRVAIVMGAEGRGLRQLTRSTATCWPASPARVRSAVSAYRMPPPLPCISPRCRLLQRRVITRRY